MNVMLKRILVALGSAAAIAAITIQTIGLPPQG
jgi:hypothetical protein